MTSGAGGGGGGGVGGKDGLEGGNYNHRALDVGSLNIMQTNPMVAAARSNRLGAPGARSSILL